MSVSWCIKCEQTVSMYEKYCQDCVDKYGVAQDINWHKTYHDWKDRFEEFEKDVLLKGGDDA